MSEDIEKLFKKTTAGFYLSCCVENGTMDKDFYKNQLDNFSEGFKAAEEQKPVVDEQKKRWAEEIIGAENYCARDGFKCPFSCAGFMATQKHHEQCILTEAQKYLETLEA